jgi:hypothetical protein
MTGDDTWRSVEEDGDISEHVKNNDPEDPVWFEGYEPFRLLVDLGIIVPGTFIRQVYPIGRDEIYCVTADERLMGITNCDSPGQEGVHNPQDILTTDHPRFHHWEYTNPARH